MAFDYIKAQNTAVRLISKFGATMPLMRMSSDYDPVTGVNSNELMQISEATVVSLPASSGAVKFDNRFLEDLKQGRIRFFYVAALGLDFAPEAGDHFYFEGKTWDIAGATPLNPAGVPVIYTIGGRESGKGSFADIITTAVNNQTEADLSTQQLIELIESASKEHILFEDLPPLP